MGGNAIDVSRATVSQCGPAQLMTANAGRWFVGSQRTRTPRLDQIHMLYALGIIQCWRCFVNWRANTT